LFINKILIGVSDTNVTRPDVTSIANNGLDATKVGWELLNKNATLETNLLALQKRVLVEYYRIFLTIKYSAEFESYKKKLRTNRRKEF
jgi:hypothetical protein